MTILSPLTDPDGVVKTAPSKVTNFKDDIESYPPTRGQFTPLVDGVVAYQAMGKAILEAKESIYLTNWFIQFDAKLFIDGTEHVIKDLLKKKAEKGVKVRLLVSYLETQSAFGFDFGFEWAKDVPAHIKAFRESDSRLNDAVQISWHPFHIQLALVSATPGASHERLLIVDRKKAFCGGFSFTATHTFGDKTHERNETGSSTGGGRRWHDLQSLIEGPAVLHFEHRFHTRWERLRQARDPQVPCPWEKDAIPSPTSAPTSSPTSGAASSTADPKELDPPKTDDKDQAFDATKTKHAVQLAITRSTPSSATNEFKTVNADIRDAYLQAVGEAEQYIYIENQYFRDEALVDALTKQLEKKPELQLIILLPIQSEETEEYQAAVDRREVPEKKPIFALHAEFVQFKMIEKLRKTTALNSRIGVYSLRVAIDKPIYVHGKLMIIDDKWLTLGSANANPRSFGLDDESNIIVRDNKVATDLRIALWKEHLSERMVLTQLSTLKTTEFVSTWNKAAKQNDDRLKSEEKKMSAGHVITHIPPSGEELTLAELNKKIDSAGASALKKFIEPKFILQEINKYVMGDVPAIPVG